MGCEGRDCSRSPPYRLYCDPTPFPHWLCKTDLLAQPALPSSKEEGNSFLRSFLTPSAQGWWSGTVGVRAHFQHLRENNYKCEKKHSMNLTLPTPKESRTPQGGAWERSRSEWQRQP